MKLDFKTGSFYVGDCLEIMPKLGAGSIDMVLCDLPYGTTQNKWDTIIPFDPLWSCYWNALKPNGPAVLTAQCPFDKVLGVSQLKYLKYEWVWKKSVATGHLNSKKQPMKEHENILVFYKEQCVYNPQMVVGEKPSNKSSRKQKASASTNYGNFKNFQRGGNLERYPRTVQKFNSPYHTNDAGLHPTQKPVALFEYLIRTYTNPAELVLDNCAGSGTTAIAAMQSGRRWICIEQNEEYASAALARIWEAEATLT